MRVELVQDKESLAGVRTVITLEVMEAVIDAAVAVQDEALAGAVLVSNAVDSQALADSLSIGGCQDIEDVGCLGILVEAMHACVEQFLLVRAINDLEIIRIHKNLLIMCVLCLRDRTYC